MLYFIKGPIELYLCGHIIVVGVGTLNKNILFGA